MYLHGWYIVLYDHAFLLLNPDHIELIMMSACIRMSSELNALLKVNSDAGTCNLSCSEKCVVYNIINYRSLATQNSQYML